MKVTRDEEIRKALEAMCLAMVENKAALRVTAEQRGPDVKYRVECAPSDMRRLIGTAGGNFSALSTLVWSMGNILQPTLKTELLRFEHRVMEAPVEDDDPADLFASWSSELSLPSLRSMGASHLRALMDRAGAHASELRAYLLAMRADELTREARQFLSK